MRPFLLVGLLLALSACDQDRITKLEEQSKQLAEQNKQLSTRLDALQHRASLDDQAKCASAAKTYFAQNWSPDKDTHLLDYTNHFSQSRNKCFIEIIYNYRLAAYPDTELTIRSAMIFDVYERVKWGEFVEQLTFYSNVKKKSEEQVQTCDVAGQQCKTSDEFKALSRPLMTE